MDCKAHRKEKRLEIINLVLDKPKLKLLDIDAATKQTSPLRERLVVALADACRDYAKFNRCTEISLTRCSPTSLSKPLRIALQNT